MTSNLGHGLLFVLIDLCIGLCFRKNLELGILTGMVKSQSSCKAGADAMRDYYKHIITTEGKWKSISIVRYVNIEISNLRLASSR